MTKIAIWTFTMAVIVVAVIVGMLGAELGSTLTFQLHGKSLPPLTGLWTKHPWCSLIVPIPLILVATWFSRRGAASTDRALVFASIAMLAVVSLVGFAALALALPFILLFAPI